LRERVPHHLIDIVEPTQRFTVADWLARARDVIATLHSGGKRPIIVGGTNLYLVALLEGMFEGPPTDDAFRGSLADIDAKELHGRLSKVDPEAAQRIAPNDRKRIVRALEVYEATGQPISALQTQWGNIPHPTSDIPHFTLIGLDWPTDQINPRINLRVKAMFHPRKVDTHLAEEVCPNGESLPEEVARLDAAGLLGPQAREALGYKQILAAMHGADPKIKSIDDAFERTKVLTRRFAKQQRTWFKRFRGVTWLDVSRGDLGTPADRAAAAVDPGR
jgi:tRNA dimethylallyltransferase